MVEVSDRCIACAGANKGDMMQVQTDTDYLRRFGLHTVLSFGINGSSDVIGTVKKTKKALQDFKRESWQVLRVTGYIFRRHREMNLNPKKSSGNRNFRSENLERSIRKI
jgi:hypothetical protein